MSRYTCYYNSRKNVYRDLAIRWNKCVITKDLTEEQKKGVALFFRSIAKRFGLINEFKEIGII